ncbi:hypothetical protein [Evansella tamaricis]|uniref:Uncharacterized protein n=1 Tax=Evansella tamaricis TaxID=2069301 RepID=A0ABS6JIF4_9BACI|nr:hypothetical protein [Evansella tamaricis]MBU9713160.1 hypothetical protein [Evansella tamaricis]
MSNKKTFFLHWHQFWYDWHQTKAYYYGSKRHERAMIKHDKKWKSWQKDLTSPMLIEEKEEKEETDQKRSFRKSFSLDLLPRKE